MSELHDAVKNNNIERVKRILTNLPILNEKDECGWTALFHSVSLGHSEITQLLLGAGARRDLLDGSGCAAVHYALIRGDAEMIDLIRENDRASKSDKASEASKHISAKRQ